MKKFRFLLLDAGPIIKLFSLGIWDDFIKHTKKFREHYTRLGQKDFIQDRGLQ